MNKLNCVAVYTNKNDTSVFDAVVILMENHDDMIAVSVSNEGLFEGVEYISKSGVFLIETDDSYCKEIEKHLIDKDISVFMNIFTDEPNLKKQLIQYCIRFELPVEIELYNSNYIDIKGIPEELNESEMKIDKLDHNNSDGCATISNEAVTRIYIDYDNFFSRFK